MIATALLALIGAALTQLGVLAIVLLLSPRHP